MPYLVIASLIAGIVFSIISITKNESLKGFGFVTLASVIVILGIGLFDYEKTMNHPKHLQILISDYSEDTKTDRIRELEELEKQKTKKILNNEVEVTYGKIKVTKDKTGKKHSNLIVTIKNKTNNKRNFEFVFVAFDSSGEYITDEIIYLENLNPGTTVTKEIFKDLTGTELNSIENSTIRIISASSYKKTH